MVRIDWVVLCDLAFFDRQDRLCIVGIVRTLPAPHLPLAIHQMMLVARLTDIQPVEEVAVSIAVVTPSGVLTTSNSSDYILVELAHQYVLVTLRGIPLHEEGVYRFRIALNRQAPVFVDVPVLMAAVPATAELN